MPKRVLVAGATGMIGRKLLPLLLSGGHEVGGHDPPRGGAPDGDRAQARSGKVAADADVTSFVPVDDAAAAAVARLVDIDGHGDGLHGSDDPAAGDRSHRRSRRIA